MVTFIKSSKVTLTKQIHTITIPLYTSPNGGENGRVRFLQILNIYKFYSKNKILKQKIWIIGKSCSVILWKHDFSKCLNPRYTLSNKSFVVFFFLENYKKSFINSNYNMELSFVEENDEQIRRKKKQKQLDLKFHFIKASCD